MVIEAIHGSQNASAAVTIGIATGIYKHCLIHLDIPLEKYWEQDAKKMLLGKKAATKEDVIEG